MMENDRVRRGETVVSPDHEKLQYMGRVDHTDPKKPFFIYAGSWVLVTFRGTDLAVEIENLHNWNENYLGVVIDHGIVNKIRLSEDREAVRYAVCQHLPDAVHQVTLFKCQDSVNYYKLVSLHLNEGGKILSCAPLPSRKMEFYGDSVTAGACCEAHMYAGCEDPESQGEYCNAWYAYSLITARMLNAQIHNMAQGGIALLPGTGYFELPETRGMLDVYDKLGYVTPLGISEWDFEKYIPQVVVIAIGQNDNYPEISVEGEAEYLTAWKEKYKELLHALRNRYEKALIITATTIMIHNPVWDEMIKKACGEMQDAKIVYFTYRQNAAATPGHIRVSEAYGMAEELTGFIESFGEEIWEAGTW